MGPGAVPRPGVLVAAAARARAPGALFLAYVGLYSLGRFFTEALRTDALMLGPLRMAQLISVLGVVLAVIGVPLLLKRARSA